MVKSNNDVVAMKSAVVTTLDADPGLLVQTGASLLYGCSLGNAAAALTYVHFYNAAAISDVTLGTTVPDAIVVLPTSLPLSVLFVKPIAFPKGIVAYSLNATTGTTGAACNGAIYYA
jgi:hypothetical protein